MSDRPSFSPAEAARVAAAPGLDFVALPFDLEQFRQGMQVELEHGRRDPETNVTGDDALTTGKIALAHLREIPDHYTWLAKMETEAEAAFAERNEPA